MLALCGSKHFSKHGFGVALLSQLKEITGGVFFMG